MHISLPIAALLLAVSPGCGQVTRDDALLAPDGAPPPDGSPDPVDECAAAEVCNGVDDDCDELVDEGCPLAGPLGSGERTTSGLYGSQVTHGQANTAFTLVCPEGAAIVGFHGRATESIDALGALCGTPAIQVDEATLPWTVTVEVSDEEPTPARGGTGGTVFERRCPEHMVITSVQVWTAPYSTLGESIYGLTATCSSYRLTGQPGDLALARGDGEELERIARGNVNVPPSPSDVACPGDAMLTEITGYYGPWPLYNAYTTVNGLRFTCAERVFDTVPAVPCAEDEGCRSGGAGA
jgi:hypothetical protein